MGAGPSEAVNRSIEHPSSWSGDAARRGPYPAAAVDGRPRVGMPAPPTVHRACVTDDGFPVLPAARPTARCRLPIRGTANRPRGWTTQRSRRTPTARTATPTRPTARGTSRCARCSSRSRSRPPGRRRIAGPRPASCRRRGRAARPAALIVRARARPGSATCVEGLEVESSTGQGALAPCGSSPRDLGFAANC